MCSTKDERLAQIGRAIDELAADSVAPRRAGSDASMEDRLAGIWAMIAELDPELARRVPDYHPDPGQSPYPRQGPDPSQGPDPRQGPGSGQSLDTSQRIDSGQSPNPSQVTRTRTGSPPARRAPRNARLSLP